MLGSPIGDLGIWHGSSDAEPSYAEHIHEPYLRLWSDAERGWAEGIYHSPGFQSVRERFIEIARALDTTRPGTESSGGHVSPRLCFFKGTVAQFTDASP